MPILADYHLHSSFSGDSDIPMERMIERGIIPTRKRKRAAYLIWTRQLMSVGLHVVRKSMRGGFICALG